MPKNKRKKQNANKQPNRREVEIGIAKAYYLRNLNLMIERELDVKVKPWQKFLLKIVQKGFGVKDAKRMH